MEMKRLGCTFSFLRRSFYKDLNIYTAADVITRINEIYLDDNLHDDMNYQQLKSKIEGLTEALI